uniref:Uncharacterized protein n=1 Tax=Zea mays TaxID=4577 RepID=C0PD81_MAIZE|nr:unknown [Zea mays]
MLHFRSKKICLSVDSGRCSVQILQTSPVAQRSRSTVVSQQCLHQI